MSKLTNKDEQWKIQPIFLLVEKPGPLDLNVMEFVWNCKVKRGYVVILMMTGAHSDTWNPGGIHLGYPMLCSELNSYKLI